MTGPAKRKRVGRAGEKNHPADTATHPVRMGSNSTIPVDDDPRTEVVLEWAARKIKEIRLSWRVGLGADKKKRPVGGVPVPDRPGHYRMPQSTPGNPLYELCMLLPRDLDDEPYHPQEIVPPYGERFAPYDDPHWWNSHDLMRSNLAKLFAWSIPSPGDIRWIKHNLYGAGIVEVGAGNGYWAWQLRQVGVDVVAYDPKPGDTHWCTAGTYTAVHQGDATAAAEHSDRALLLCWPPFGDPMGADALRAFQGHRLFYVGESQDGCCGDDDMFQILRDDWELRASSADHVSWDGIHCDLSMWVRRT